jgi:hypothetical protein
MRFLAASEMPRGLSTLLRRRTVRVPRLWHAVEDTDPRPAIALCGHRYTSEPHRTWDQVILVRQCPKCQRLVPQQIEDAPRREPWVR